MVTCSAPAKIYLFGEHAVVYGEPAIACAVDLRTYVTIERSRDISILSELGSTGIDYEKHPYVSACIENLKIKGASVKIRSQIPIGAGLGSSAAVTVATICALGEEFGLGLDKPAIAETGHKIEMQIQGAASPTDTYVSTMGGTFRIPDRRRLPGIDCGIIIGNTNSGCTEKKTSRLVEMVADLKKKYPELINPILKTIGTFAESGEMFINNKEYREVGKLMNLNHGLLDALGVGTAELSALVYAARNSGAYGAKITGAGGGGCMVALAPQPGKVADAINAAGGTAIITKVSPQGVRVE